MLFFPPTEPLDPQLKEATPSSRAITLRISTLNKLSALPLEGVTVEYRQSNDNQWASKYIAVKDSPAASSAETDHIQALGPHGLAAVTAGKREDVVDGSGDIEVRVGGFVPYSVYHVRVKLVNVLGEGPVSQSSVRVFMLPDGELGLVGWGGGRGEFAG